MVAIAIPPLGSGRSAFLPTPAIPLKERPLADIRETFDDARMASTERSDLIPTLRARHRDTAEQLKKARDEGDRAQTRAWEAAFKRISTLRYEAGDDLNAPIW